MKIQAKTKQKLNNLHIELQVIFKELKEDNRNISNNRLLVACNRSTVKDLNKRIEIEVYSNISNEIISKIIEVDKVIKFCKETEDLI